MIGHKVELTSCREISKNKMLIKKKLKKRLSWENQYRYMFKKKKST